jgi:hypothetical protein
MVKRRHMLVGLVVVVHGLLIRSLFSSFNFFDPVEGWNEVDAMIQNMMVLDPAQLVTKTTTLSTDNKSNKPNSDMASAKRIPAPLPYHDKSSLTSYMWLKGEIFNPQLEERPLERAPLVVDAISIGSQFNVAQMEGQAKSWGSHWSMRYLFGTTEEDDADPYCNFNLTDQQFSDILLHCKKKVNYRRNRLKAIRSNFPSPKWIELRNKTKGWLCAQPRFAHAIGKVGRFYRREVPKSLPDFFFIQDDDTWFGMTKLLEFLSTRNHTRPFTTAGCVVRLPFHIVNFTFPFGGFGTMMNRLSLERLIKPIYCNEASSDQHTALVCLRLKENLVGERMAFEDGMSVSDLMDRHATMHPYVYYKKWGDPGYCMLGDWVIGYYFNYYGIGSRQMAPLDYVHMDQSLGYIYKMPGTGACLSHNVQHCRNSKDQHVCHRMKPRHMHEMNTIDANKTSGY